MDRVTDGDRWGQSGQGGIVTGWTGGQSDRVTGLGHGFSIGFSWVSVTGPKSLTSDSIEIRG